MFRRMRILREQENEQGAAGAGDTGAQGTGPAPAEEPQKSINSQAKELPWVQNALKAEAELAKLKQSIADDKAKAEKAKLEAEGNYKVALEMEQKKLEDATAKHAAEIKDLQLRAEFATSGMQDLRAVQIFAAEFNPDTESAEEFVSRIKADEKNAMYFSESKQSTMKPPAASGNANLKITEEQAHRWKNSSDKEKRARAKKYFSAKYFSKKKE